MILTMEWDNVVLDGGPTCEPVCPRQAFPEVSSCAGRCEEAGRLIRGYLVRGTIRPWPGRRITSKVAALPAKSSGGPREPFKREMLTCIIMVGDLEGARLPRRSECDCGSFFTALRRSPRSRLMRGGVQMCATRISTYAHKHSHTHTCTRER